MITQAQIDQLSVLISKELPGTHLHWSEIPKFIARLWPQISEIIDEPAEQSTAPTAADNGFIPTMKTLQKIANCPAVLELCLGCKKGDPNG